MTLPTGWVEASLGEIAETRLGKMLDAVKNRGDERPYLRNVNVRWGAFDLSDLHKMPVTKEEFEALRVRDGDIFVCEGGEPGRCAVWRGGTAPIVYQKALHRIRAPEGVDPDYLARWLEYSVRLGRADHLLTGTTIKHLPQIGLQKVTIPLPPSAEQGRIVAKLDVVSARLGRARAQARHARNACEQFKRSLLRSAVTGTLSGGWRILNTRGESAREMLARISVPQQAPGGREATDKIIAGTAGLAVNDPGQILPEGWAWVPLLRVAKQETGHTPSRSKPSYWDGGVPWIGIRDAGAHHGRIIQETAQTISDEGLANSSARLLPAGTVCLSRTASVGYVTVMGLSMSTSQDFVTWTCTDALLPEYLMYALMAEGDDIRRFGMGSTHTTIYFPEIRALHIALPPIAEQLEIVRRVQEAFARADRLEAEARKALALIDRLEAAILTKAFRGELVPQDSDDEPAKVLLERIRARRAAEPKARRGRRAIQTA